VRRFLKGSGWPTYKQSHSLRQPSRERDTERRLVGNGRSQAILLTGWQRLRSVGRLTVTKGMPKGTPSLSGCQILPKGKWWGVILIDLIESSQAQQIAVPLTDGTALKVWAPASQLYIPHVRSVIDGCHTRRGSRLADHSARAKTTGMITYVFLHGSGHRRQSRNFRSTRRSHPLQRPRRPTIPRYTYLEIDLRVILGARLAMIALGMSRCNQTAWRKHQPQRRIRPMTQALQRLCHLRSGTRE
jgi:hypothetical protein